MGRKKAFIDKKNAVTYALMARPEGEEDGDDAVDPAARGAQVWMRKDDNHHVRDALAEASGDDGSVFNDAFETGTMYSGATGMTGYSSMSNVTFIMGPNGPVPRRERLSREKRRELRELGFDPNDGYDYTRHLRRVGEGGGVMFVPTRKDHVKGVRDPLVSAGGSGKRGVDEEQVFLREDVERDGAAAVAIGDERRRAEEEEEERWTHERVKAVTDVKVYAAKDDTVANAVVARKTSAPRAGVAATELEEMIEKMEEFELAGDEDLPDLREDFDDGGLGDLQDDFILQAMMGGGEDGEGDGEGGESGAAVPHEQRQFPPIRLRYDDAEVENQLATVEEAVEEEALEEEEAQVGGGGWIGGGGGFGYAGSDAGTDRDLDEDDWIRAREDLGADARDVDEQFEAMARGYDSDEIGELDEDDPRIFGHAELDRFGHVMDEFVKEHAKEQYRTAADVLEGGANADEMDAAERDRDFFDDDDRRGVGGGPHAPRVTEDDVDDAFGSMIATRRRAGLPLPEHLAKEMTLGDASGSGGASDEVARRFEMEEDGPAAAPDGAEIAYLRTKQRESWDCETIVSTYSNLENHPSLIDEPHGGSRRKKKKGRGGGDEDVGATEGAAVIRLSQSNGLPVDYVQSRRGRGRGGSLLTAANLAAVAEAHDEGDANVEDDDAWEGSGGEDDDMEDGEAWRSNIRRRGESAEEKRARKAAVKQGRRDARAAKKGLKTTFKREEREMGKKQMVGDVRPGLSVTQLG